MSLAPHVGGAMTPRLIADLTIVEVATRIGGKSKRWLQSRLADDARRPPDRQRLQHHHYVGRTPLWTEAEFQALRQAIIEEDTEKRRPRGSKSSNETVSGTSTGLRVLRDAQSALERVLALKPGQTPGTTLRPSGSGRNRKSAPQSSTVSSRASRLQLQLIDTSAESVVDV